jgi:L-amino acid N-acyltransferase YncA
MPVRVRPIAPADVPAACAILNRIITIGGTTAHQHPYDAARFEKDYVVGDNLICCHVALDETDRVAGFQWLGRNPDLPDGCADIATFARRAPVLPGVGTALFAVTRAVADSLGLREINATIRADNRSGLGYYAKMGFVEHSVSSAVPLSDGTPVDRISKRFTLRPDQTGAEQPKDIE